VKPTPQHTPFVQASPVEHATPQAPQFCESVVSFTHAFPHIAAPLGQAQMPPWQVAPGGHVPAQVPAALSPASWLPAALVEAPLAALTPALTLEPELPAVAPELIPVALASIDPVPAFPDAAPCWEG
jgi:hypothetical protein